MYISTVPLISLSPHTPLYLSSVYLSTLYLPSIYLPTLLSTSPLPLLYLPTTSSLPPHYLFSTSPLPPHSTSSLPPHSTSSLPPHSTSPHYLFTISSLPPTTFPHYLFSTSPLYLYTTSPSPHSTSLHSTSPDTLLSITDFPTPVCVVISWEDNEMLKYSLLNFTARRLEKGFWRWERSYCTQCWMCAYNVYVWSDWLWGKGGIMGDTPQDYCHSWKVFFTPQFSTFSLPPQI